MKKGDTIMPKCVLYDRECVDCGECDEFCDITPGKRCDNCGKCLETDKRYKIIKITKILTEENEK